MYSYPLRTKPEASLSRLLTYHLEGQLGARRANGNSALVPGGLGPCQLGVADGSRMRKMIIEVNASAEQGDPSDCRGSHHIRRSFACRTGVPSGQAARGRQGGEERNSQGGPGGKPPVGGGTLEETRKPSSGHSYLRHRSVPPSCSAAGLGGIDAAEPGRTGSASGAIHPSPLNLCPSRRTRSKAKKSATKVRPPSAAASDLCESPTVAPSSTDVHTAITTLRPTLASRRSPLDISRAQITAETVAKPGRKNTISTPGIILAACGTATYSRTTATRAHTAVADIALSVPGIITRPSCLNCLGHAKSARCLGQC